MSQWIFKLSCGSKGGRRPLVIGMVNNAVMLQRHKSIRRCIKSFTSWIFDW